MTASPPEAATGRSRRTLALGFAAIAIIVVVEGGVDGYLTRSAQQSSRISELNALASIELIDRITRDVDQERVLVGDHIYEAEQPKMAEIEGRLAKTTQDLEAAKARYSELRVRPEEERLWDRIEVLLARFDGAKSRILPLSRRHLNAQALAEMNTLRDDYSEASDLLTALVQFNRAGVATATERVAALRKRTNDSVLVLRAVELLSLALLAWWGGGRITLYETRMIEHARAIEDRNRDLDAFAGRVAHDLRNALTPMFMLPRLLRQSATDAERVREMSERLERTATRARLILEALLAFSRSSGAVEAGERGLLQTAVDRVLEELAPAVGRLGATIDVEPVPDVALRCSPGLLHVVLVNVIGNAVKYLEGRVVRCVRVSFRVSGRSCRIEVADTGPGIPPEAEARIFEPFYRVKGTRAAGTGLGLATVRRIVEARDGRVGVESVEGRGATFWMVLPLAAPEATAS
jgi:signal transduction histidine kinase